MTALRISGLLLPPGRGSTAIAAFLLEKLPACTHQRRQLGSRARPIATTQQLDVIAIVGKMEPYGTGSTLRRYGSTSCFRQALLEATQRGVCSQWAAGEMLIAVDRWSQLKVRRSNSGQGKLVSPQAPSACSITSITTPCPRSLHLASRPRTSGSPCTSSSRQSQAASQPAPQIQHWLSRWPEWFIAMGRWEGGRVRTVAGRWG